MFSTTFHIDRQLLECGVRRVSHSVHTVLANCNDERLTSHFVIEWNA